MAQGHSRKKLDLTGQTFGGLEVLAANTVHRNNTSGGPSVDLVATKRLWRAMIRLKGRGHYLGGYHKFEDAVLRAKASI